MFDSAGRRGKSGLNRTGLWLTAIRGNARNRATESKPPMAGYLLRLRQGGNGAVSAHRDCGNAVGTVTSTWSTSKQRARIVCDAGVVRVACGEAACARQQWRAQTNDCHAQFLLRAQNPAYRPALHTHYQCQNNNHHALFAIISAVMMQSIAARRRKSAAVE